MKENEGLYRWYATTRVDVEMRNYPYVNWKPKVEETKFYYLDERGRMRDIRTRNDEVAEHLYVQTGYITLVCEMTTHQNGKKYFFLFEMDRTVYGVFFRSYDGVSFDYDIGEVEHHGALLFLRNRLEKQNVQSFADLCIKEIKQLPAYRLYEATGLLTFKSTT